MNKPGNDAKGERTIPIGLGFCSFGQGSNAAVTDIKNGKILRIRPLHYDWKYKPEEFGPWKITARGQSFEPTMKSLLPPFSLGYKKRVYSPNRILYPLKRVDWDPKGDRNPQNRGKSNYVRISCFIIPSSHITDKNVFTSCSVGQSALKTKKRII